MIYVVRTTGCNTLRPQENWVVLLSMSCLCESEPFFDPCEVVSARVFYSSRSSSYNES
jgi:hypothetical protein